MTVISAADVSKLRKTTGAGMMDCKKALEESAGDFDQAIDIIRKKGQLVANKRADREATEGVVLSKVVSGKGAMICLNCETDFVAKNANFIKFAESILDVAVNKNVSSLEELKSAPMESKTVEELVVEQIGVIGEKLDLSYFGKIEAAEVVPYIHSDKKLSTLVGFSKKVDLQVGKDIAMQIAAMSPVAVDKADVPAAMIEKEKEIGREQARLEGKPEEMLDKIAEGKLNKFFKEYTLLNQEFTKDSKKSVAQYLKDSDPEVKVTEFLRFPLKQ
jgi:elongation factor Ts